MSSIFQMRISGLLGFIFRTSVTTPGRKKGVIIIQIGKRYPSPSSPQSDVSETVERCAFTMGGNRAVREAQTGCHGEFEFLIEATPNRKPPVRREMGSI
jgi:hypothetical protein